MKPQKPTTQNENTQSQETDETNTVRLVGRCPDTLLGFKNNINQRKENNSNWKGGISIRRGKEKQKKLAVEIRQAILERDNYSCQMCGMTQEQHIVLYERGLTIDHKDGNGIYSEEQNNSPENLETLCYRCHGKKDGKRSWNNTFKRIIDIIDKKDVHRKDILKETIRKEFNLDKSFRRVLE